MHLAASIEENRCGDVAANLLPANSGHVGVVGWAVVLLLQYC